MSHDHWFDTLNKALIRPTGRRGALSAVSALLAALLWHDPSGITLAHTTLSCSLGVCHHEFRKKKDRKHCEFICHQCDGDDPREFCIVKENKPNGKLTKVARCCKEGKQCCGGTCCGSRKNPGVRRCGGDCVDTSKNHDHCGSCHTTCVGPNLECCPGAGCVVTRNNERHCGGCDPCPASKPKCCGDTCVDPLSDHEHCGPRCNHCARDFPGHPFCCRGACINPNEQRCCPPDAPGQTWCPKPSQCCVVNGRMQCCSCGCAAGGGCASCP
jgi:hypothetical protein